MKPWPRPRRRSDVAENDVDPGDVLLNAAGLLERTTALLRRAEAGRIVQDGLVVSIVGRTNVGKSTLFNALPAEEQAIVAPTPGTTRDTVGAEPSLGGIPVRLIGTAGPRETGDPAEAEGVRRAERALDRADLVLLVLDRSAPLSAEDQGLLIATWGAPTLLLLSKADLPRGRETIGQGRFRAVPEVSAQTGEGLRALEAEILRLFSQGEVACEGTALLLDAWERDLLGRIRDALDGTRRGLEGRAFADTVVEELRTGLRAAGGLTGAEVGETTLREIFSRFCVGK